MSRKKHIITLEYSLFEFSNKHIIFFQIVNNFSLTLEVTTGPNSARAISADRAPAEIRPNLV